MQCRDTGAILTSIVRRRRGLTALRRRTPAVARELVEEPEDLPEAAEIQEMSRWRSGITRGWSEIIGAAQCDGGMAGVREPDDGIRGASPTEPDDLELLAGAGQGRFGVW